MAMNMKRSMKMRGFMCHSPAATAVCVTGDPRSVIVPRRPDRTLVDHATLVNTAKYTRLVESRRFGTSAHKIRSTTTPLPPIKSHQDIIASKRSTATMPPIKIHQDTDRDRQALQKPSPLASSDQIFQVVVMRVSLHCQGCAGKVKKHLSKMEGVTSFSIDLESKRVTVMGHVSPVGVLESISKVKRAEFWPC